MIVGMSQDNSPSPMIKTVEASMIDSSKRGYNRDDGEEVVNYDNGDDNHQLDKEKP